MVSVPYLRASSVSFQDSTIVELFPGTDRAEVYYYTSGPGETGVQSLQYTSPITLKTNTTLNAFSLKQGLSPSEEITATFVRNYEAELRRGRMPLGYTGETLRERHFGVGQARLDPKHAAHRSLPPWKQGKVGGG